MEGDVWISVYNSDVKNITTFKDHIQRELTSMRKFLDKNNSKNKPLAS